MKKKFFPFLIVSLFIFLLSTATPANAALPSELQRKIEETKRQHEALLEEQRKLQAELNRTAAESRTLQGAVNSLDSSRRKLASDIKLTESNIKNANLRIDALENALTEKEYQINIHQGAITEILQALAMRGSQSIFIDLLYHGNISDVWVDSNSRSELQEKLSAEIDALRDTRVILDKEKQLKEQTKNQLVGFKSELSGQQKVIVENQNAKTALLAQTKSKEAEYQKLLADNIARQKAFEADLFRFESELKTILDPTKLPSTKTGALSWPLDNVTITQRFGTTADSGRLYVSGTHNGVDFRAAVGTAVKSAGSGVVQGIGNTDSQRGCYSYGRWVLIRHDNGLSSMYAHLSSAIVSEGQTVVAGQVIGYSGGSPGANGSGYSTGPHLHFGVYASQGVKIAPYTTSINCKNVSIPIADPKAYLDPLAYLPVL